MTYRIRWQQRDNRQGLDGRVAVIDDGRGSCLEVWPALGFNAYRWAVAGAELLYADPQLFENGRPTRSGIPILFPFPNRIRAGAFTWDGRSYQLPLNDPAKANAIHGFACRVPWRVIDEGASTDEGWITGEFQLSRDAPAAMPLWPADARLRVTYRLQPQRLRIEAVVDAPGAALPFGLGYHPYFALAPFGGEQAIVSTPADQYWELRDSLPTGTRHPVEGMRDLRRGQPYAALTLDDVLTDVPPGAERFGAVQHPAGAPTLRLHGSADFRDVVAFTPPHRQAICLEPYTCTTDAINLQQAGVDAGWKVLAPGENWHAVFEMVCANPQAS